MQLPVIVLDLNGVLVDVRKLAEKRLLNPDLVLPNYQQVYYRPGVFKFIDWLLCQPITIVVWTSRKRKNAMPIVEKLFKDKTMVHIFTGENCCKVPHLLHPIKHTYSLAKSLQCKEKDIYMVDDSLEYISGCANILPISTFKADYVDDDDVLITLQEKLQTIINAYNE